MGDADPMNAAERRNYKLGRRSFENGDDSWTVVHNLFNPVCGPFCGSFGGQVSLCFGEHFKPHHKFLNSGRAQKGRIKMREAGLVL